MTWREEARRFIDEIVGPESTFPQNSTLDERKKMLRRHASQFHGGTSWGKKIWAQESRAHLALHGQALPRAQSPRLLAAMESGDIIFPFRGESDVLRG